MRYVIVISLDTGDIAWVSGLFPCGLNPFILIFRKGMKFELKKNERVVAVKGYLDGVCLTPDTMMSLIPPSLHSLLRASHETANQRLKQFRVLSAKYLHHLSFHGYFFTLSLV